MEHDRVAEALLVAIAASLRLDLLDLRVHRFTKSIGRFQHDRVDDSVERPAFTASPRCFAM